VNTVTIVPKVSNGVKTNSSVALVAGNQFNPINMDDRSIELAIVVAQVHK
jgi:hypothetical protein